ncbi:MAG: serine/threonine-protein kinase [Rubrivivax sp.]
MPLEDADTELSARGVDLGPFVLEDRIGVGGMGAVFRARDRRSGERVAVKILREKKPELVRRFAREARIAASLRHPNVVVVHEILTPEAGAPAIVMELLEGESLAARLAREEKLAASALVPIARAIADAVNAAHARGVIHRDLKPDNVFLVKGDVVKVLDFGIAKLTAPSAPTQTGAPLTETGEILGTPQYMAPEVIFGEAEIDARADVWSLGVIMYEALAGARPFDGENAGQVFKAIALDPHVPLEERAPDAPLALSRLVERMLAHSRAERVASLDEVARALSELDAHEPARARTEPPPRPRPYGALAAVACAGVAAVALAFALNAKPAPPAVASAVVASAPAEPSEPASPPSASSAPPIASVAASAAHRSAPRVLAPSPRSSLAPTPPPPSASSASPAPRHRSGDLKPEEL